MRYKSPTITGDLLFLFVSRGVIVLYNVTFQKTALIIIQNHNASHSTHHRKTLQKSALTMIRIIVPGD